MGLRRVNKRFLAYEGRIVKILYSEELIRNKNNLHTRLMASIFRTAHSSGPSQIWGSYTQGLSGSPNNWLGFNLIIVVGVRHVTRTPVLTIVFRPTHSFRIKRKRTLLDFLLALLPSSSLSEHKICFSVLLLSSFRTCLLNDWKMIIPIVFVFQFSIKGLLHLHRRARWGRQGGWPWGRRGSPRV